MKRFIPHIPIYAAATLVLAVAALLAGCSTSDLPGSDDAYPCTFPAVQVADGGYAPASTGQSPNAGMQPPTRAAENGYKTQFTAGDRIGLYAVKNSEIAADCNNLCLTLTNNGGTLTWILSAGSNVWNEEPGAAITYYAYYPYQANMTGKVTAAAGDAAGFFAPLVSSWTLTSDQSAYAKYTAQDLMTGTGAMSGSGSAHTLLLTLTHQMALAVIKTPTTKYTLTDAGGNTLPDYIIPATDLRFNGFTPCLMADGSQRYLVIPNDTIQYSGSYTNASGNTLEFLFTPDIAAGSYATYTVDGATITEKSHTLQTGDFYLKDGSLVGKDADLSDAQKAACIGIVFWVGDITGEDPLLEKKFPAGTKGLAIALHDAGGNSIWNSSNDDISGNWLSQLNKNIYGITSLMESEKMQGYANTKALEGYNVSDRVVPDHLGRKVLPVGIIADYATTHPTPASSSGWYWPSVKELKYICWGQGNGPSISGRMMLNTQLGEVPGAASLQSYYYWSSTEGSNSWAWYVYFDRGYVDRNGYKYYNSYGVRAVVAF